MEGYASVSWLGSMSHTDPGIAQAEAAEAALWRLVTG